MIQHVNNGTAKHKERKAVLLLDRLLELENQVEELEAKLNGAEHLLSIHKKREARLWTELLLILANVENSKSSALSKKRLEGLKKLVERHQGDTELLCVPAILNNVKFKFSV